MIDDFLTKIYPHGIPGKASGAAIEIVGDLMNFVELFVQYPTLFQNLAGDFDGAHGSEQASIP